MLQSHVDQLRQEVTSPPAQTLNVGIAVTREDRLLLRTMPIGYWLAAIFAFLLTRVVLLSFNCQMGQPQGNDVQCDGSPCQMGQPQGNDVQCDGSPLQFAAPRCSSLRLWPPNNLFDQSG